jgi:hypothetical protein
MAKDLLLMESFVPSHDLEDGAADVVFAIELDFAAGAGEIAANNDISGNASLRISVRGTVVGSVAVCCIGLVSGLLDFFLRGVNDG